MTGKKVRHFDNDPLDSSYIELSIVLDCRVSIVTAARLVDIRIDGHCQCPPGRTQQTKTTSSD